MGFALALTLMCMRTPAVAPPPVHRQAKPVWPAQGRITGVYGNDGGRHHPGIDIGALSSLTVRAAVAGRVMLVGRPEGYDGYGNVVIVRTGRQIELYAHLAAYRVHRAQRVGVGQRLGTAGCTGRCTGTHLHFEIRRNGRPVNPMRTVLNGATIGRDQGG